MYEISAYAIAEGYEKSDIIKASIYWIDSRVEDTSNINTVQKRAISVNSENGIITLTGLAEKEIVNFYTIDGKMLGKALSNSGTVTFQPNVNFVIIKISSTSIKISVK